MIGADTDKPSFSEDSQNVLPPLESIGLMVIRTGECRGDFELMNHQKISI